MMAAFRICLVGSAQHLIVELQAANVEELIQDASSSRFLAGHMVEADEHGCFPGVMVQTNRIQVAFEAS